jgi:hypothetical protein
MSTTRKHPFSGRKKRPESKKNGRRIKKMAKLPADMIGRKKRPQKHLPAARTAANL